MGMMMKATKGREFAAFRGIPYALPPIGPWRFEVSEITPKKRLNSSRIINLRQVDLSQIEKQTGWVKSC